MKGLTSPSSHDVSVSSSDGTPFWNNNQVQWTDGQNFAQVILKGDITGVSMLVGLLTRARHTCAVESPEADTTSSWEGWKRTEFTLPLWPSYCRRQASDVTHHKRQDWSEKSHELTFYQTIFNLGTNTRQLPAEAVAKMLRSSFDTATSHTPSRWPVNSRRSWHADEGGARKLDTMRLVCDLYVFFSRCEIWVLPSTARQSFLKLQIWP